MALEIVTSDAVAVTSNGSNVTTGEADPSNGSGLVTDLTSDLVTDLVTELVG